jgi:hypothetical protein
MKTYGRSLFLTACLVLLLRPPTLPAAVPDASGEPILQQELKQQQLQRTTRRVAEQLSGVITEFENNGIAGEDLRALKAIRSVLGRLSEREMLQVINLLAQARTSAEPGGGKQQLAGAYLGQKTVITLLKQLLLEYERQQALYELSIRFREMAARQGKNMRAGVWLVRNNPQDQYSEETRLAIQIQQADQLHIKEESALLVGRLDKLRVETDGTPAGERPKAAASRVREGSLLAVMDTAAEDLKARKLLSATGNEKKSRDELREIARLLLLSKDAMDLLRAAIAETEAAIMLQKQVIDDTLKLEKRADRLVVEDHQFEVVDAADLVRRDVQDVAPPAASYLRAAVDRMQEAREKLLNWDPAQKKRQEIPARQREAVTSLELALRALQEQLARAEAEANRPENTLARLQELQQQVQELVRREEQLKQEAARAETRPQELSRSASRQGDLRDATQDLQQKAAESSPPAARALSEAAAEMERSQKALARNQNAPANQQAAIDSLRKAEQELGREVARLQEAEKQLAGLEKLSEKVSDLIKQQENVNLATGKEAAQPSPSPAASGELGQQEQKLARETAESQKMAAETAPAASPHLGEAGSQMNQARDQLGKPDARSAQAPENKALSELLAAKEKIDSRIGELRQELGESPSDAGQSLADAAAALEKAQNEVSQAMSQMAAQEALPPRAMDAASQDLNQAAQDVTPVAAGDMGPLPPAAEIAVQSALRSLNSATAQASAHQQAQAQASATAAAQALAQAQAALALAEAGLGSDLAQTEPGSEGEKAQPPGQRQQPGNGQRSAVGQPGPPRQPGRGTPPPRGTGQVGNWRGAGGTEGARRSTVGSGEFLSLPGRDRAAIQQSRSESYPQEYGPMVEQYLKNLSDQAAQK